MSILQDLTEVLEQRKTPATRRFLRRNPLCGGGIIKF